MSSPSTPVSGIDPRGPRFGAGISSVLLLVVVGIGLATADSLSSSFAGRITDPAFLLLLAIASLFAWGAFAGIRRHPYGVLFARIVRPRLAPPTELEDPAPPTFAQLVGLIVTGAGVLLHLVGVPYALVVAASAAFIAAFLNSVFAYCLGCQIYLLLTRAGVISRKA